MNPETAWKLTPEEKTRYSAIAARVVPVAIKWLCSDHDSTLLRLLMKYVRVAAVTALGADGWQAIQHGQYDALIADALISAIPLAMTALAHYREHIEAWVDRRWPAKQAALPAVAEIRPPAPVTAGEFAEKPADDVPAYQAIGEMKHP
jgi:hypothetical protein